MRDRIRRWWEEPIYFPRGSMFLKYVFTTLLGLAVAVATGPSLEELTSASYSSLWGAAMLIAGAVASIGSTRKRLWRVEFAGAAVVVALLVVYALSPILLILQGDLVKLAYSVIACGFVNFPATRVVTLIRRGDADG